MTLESPVPQWMLPKVWTWMCQFSEFMVDDFTPKNYAEMEAKHFSDLCNRRTKEFAILDNGFPVGAVWCERIEDTDVFAGHLVFERDYPEKIRATKKALAIMFDSGVQSIVWLSLSTNRPFLIFLRRLKAQIKDTLPKGTVLHGQSVPVVVAVSTRESIQ